MSNRAIIYRDILNGVRDNNHNAHELISFSLDSLREAKKSICRVLQYIKSKNE